MAFVAWTLTREKPEPIWNGRSLSAWTEDLATGSSKEIRETAEDAIRHIGPAAIPSLLQMLRSRDTVLHRVLVSITRELNRRQSTMVFGVTSATEKCDRAAMAFEALGPLAHSAIPDLKKLLVRQSDPQFVADSLAAIGPEAVSAILECLPKVAPEKRYFLFSAAAKWPSQHEAIQLALLRSINSSNQYERRCAAEFLGRFKQQPSTTVPVLIAALQDPELLVRLQALQSLAEFGTNASSAVGPVRALAQNQSWFPPDQVSNVLMRIEPGN